ncbi:MAG: flavin reductase family protein [Spirochaetales bacterium]|nr:flavin reductase family protein [Spirochaetales bacterium]
MNKIKLGPLARLFPMPAVLVGGKNAGGGISFAAIAWAGIVNSEPPMLGVGIRKSRYTHSLITETGEFSVNVPSAQQAVETDFCGIVSGKEYDKAGVCGFTLFYGNLRYAPLISECPMNIECTVHKTIELPSHDLFIGRISEIHLDENLKGEGPGNTIDIEPLVFMGSRYATTHGDYGKPFSIGTKLKKG